MPCAPACVCAWNVLLVQINFDFRTQPRTLPLDQTNDCGLVSSVLHAVIVAGMGKGFLIKAQSKGGLGKWYQLTGSKTGLRQSDPNVSSFVYLAVVSKPSVQHLQV